MTLGLNSEKQAEFIAMLRRGQGSWGAFANLLPQNLWVTPRLEAGVPHRRGQSSCSDRCLCQGCFGHLRLGHASKLSLPIIYILKETCQVT